MRSRIHRITLDITVTSILAIAFGAAWIAVTGAYRPPWWVNPIAATGVVLLVGPVEAAVNAWARRRAVPARHRKARP